MGSECLTLGWFGNCNIELKVRLSVRYGKSRGVGHAAGKKTNLDRTVSLPPRTLYPPPLPLPPDSFQTVRYMRKGIVVERN